MNNVPSRGDRYQCLPLPAPALSTAGPLQCYSFPTIIITHPVDSFRYSSCRLSPVSMVLPTPHSLNCLYLPHFITLPRIALLQCDAQVRIRRCHRSCVSFMESPAVFLLGAAATLFISVLHSPRILERRIAFREVGAFLSCFQIHLEV